MRKVVGVVGAMAATLVLCASASAATPTVTQFDGGPGELDPGDAPWGITAGSDGNLWFTNTISDEIGRITPAGVVTEFELGSATAFPQDIAPAADGKLWFTEFGDNRIGRISTGGTIDHFTVPTASSQPYGITAGPGARLWFTERNANKIGSISTAGSFQGEFNLPAGSLPRDITAGPDGNLWFTEPGTDKIGRMTTAGALTEFTLPAGSDPESITPGTAQTIWFTETGTDRVKQMTTGGLVLENFALPPDADPAGITTGQDGSIWFTEPGPGVDGIGRIDPEAFTPLTHYTSGLPSGTTPNAITAGPDGNLWFAELDGSAIGRINTPVSPPAWVNPAPLQIPDGAAATYPSTIDVAGLEGPIADVQVRVTGFSHTYPDDVEMLLVAPSGEKVLLAADNGGGGTSLNEVGPAVAGLTWTFRDEFGAGSLSNDGPLVSGLFTPSQGNSNNGNPLAFPAPAPASPYGPALSALDPSNPNGTWKLFVNDDFTGDVGAIQGGWGLDIVTNGAYDDGPAQFSEDQGSGRINVLANDTTDNFLGITDVTDPPHGTAEVLAGGFPDPDEISYQPDPDYCNEPGPAPPDSFQYTIDPGGDTATVEVEVTCTPDPSVANDDLRGVIEDTGATNLDVLLNDSDADDEPVQITSATDPANGTATVIQGTPDNITYAPDPNYCNDGAPPDDTFSYTVGGGDTATVSVAVTCVDEVIPPPPTAPQTTITKAPKKKLKAKKKATARFEFSSSVGGSTFECSLDGAAPSGCSSPKTYKVKKGSHTFSVAAAAAGQEDATPATFSFSVKKKKRKK